MGNQTTDQRDGLWIKIAAPVLVLFIAGGSAPWWWNEFFPDPEPTPQTTFVPITPGPIPTLDPNGSVVSLHPEPSVDVPVELAGCHLTITNPFVSLRRSPDISSEEIADVQPGVYVTSDTQVVDFAGQDQRWFEITAEGRTGWVMYSTILVESKSAECP